MRKKFKELFSDDTEVIKTQDLDAIDELDETFNIPNQEISKKKNTKSIVKVYQPVTKSVTLSIIDSIKKGELCIINLEKVSDEEAKIIYSTLSGSIYSLDGIIKMIDQKILLCAPRNFIIDGDVAEL